MADEADRLVVAPFREIVEKANVAIENARNADDEAAAPMLKAAQSLAKEGERALKRIEPLCSDYYQEYGVNFIDAVKEHDELAQFRSELDDFLWDFDDYIEFDGFEPDKFDDLQKLSRKTAPKVLDILKRMKLVPAPTVVAALNSITKPPELSTEASILINPPSSEDKTLDEVEKKLDEALVMGSQAGPDLGIDGTDPNASSRPTSESIGSSSNGRTSSRQSEVRLGPTKPLPRPPSTNPWDVGKPLPPASPSLYSSDGFSMERRSPVPPGDSPTLPVVFPARPERTLSNGSRAHETGSNWDRQSHGSQMPSQPNSPIDKALSTTTDTSGWQNRSPTLIVEPLARLRGDSLTKSFSPEKMRPMYMSFGGPDPPRYSGHSYNSMPISNGSPINISPTLGNPSYPIPEDRVIDSHSHSGGGTGIVNFPPRQASLNTSHPQPLRPVSQESFNSSIFDCVPADGASSSVASTQRTSSVMSAGPSSPYSTVSQLPLYSAQPPPPLPPGYPNSPRSPIQPSLGANNNFSTTTVGTVTPASATFVGPGQSDMSILQPVAGSDAPQLVQRVDDPGIIPVATELPENLPMPSRKQDCTIGPMASFHQMKGFCKGAEDVMRGELGFKKVKRPQGFSTTVVAKCTHCMFELDFKVVEQDLKNDASGNFVSNNIRFRLRFLQKSHLSIRHVEDQLYACIFCTEQRKTLDESDATVFFSQKQLFAHIARHPRPLPDVLGLNIIDSVEIPESKQHMKDNFDLHFTHPPIQSIMSGIAREVGRLPTAVATDTRKSANGILRVPPDRAAALQYAVGARIVGIEFPPKYEGKWALGWHDGIRGAFELDSVHLDAPPRNETRMQGTSNIQAVARWKWSQKGEGNWLKFDKGDVIKNISWTYSDHWCWSGTSSKGWGIFPQTHVDQDSVKIIRSDSASISSAEKKGGLSRFSIRRNTDRKVDSSAGDSSHSLSKHAIF
ncbi:hypothetical protein BX600DRAFT_16720 [Xylariales sp. PMI_506]|nr:hypothetical protein BX600DRAFT_16720 [Xylariales sp. PMI_506]